ncbi:hypothetical protein HanXRQr2_Chr09g0409791 [Helianthus annuus]|uniref:Uncharacterized protein n=1 Tax=Helianthus annuus TaxID=4232 RepID=A0A9K3NAV9_HELAN|nr:hypothetical protein HanXRQr2_Chr09g0409791 [Helianthus annuus]KAJ0895041.1 hypothetical protein HanPSC8_Chr09g0395901 [Helianthus annuus]
MYCGKGSYGAYIIIRGHGMQSRLKFQLLGLGNKYSKLLVIWQMWVLIFKIPFVGSWGVGMGSHSGWIAGWQMNH